MSLITATLYGVEVVGIDHESTVVVVSIPRTKAEDYHGEWYLGGDYPIRIGGQYPLVD